MLADLFGAFWKPKKASEVSYPKAENNIFGVGESVRNIMAFGQIVVLCLCRAKLNELCWKPRGNLF